ncbi:PREDICTED: uncharacterized protein LOC106804698 [Priapulus caudatus]|uniref:Uncharacterized protein LOC106804698 n=1 Tax=Priapulus caudatus TaxID=37621 RepID=A0ABM1DNE9_PRICU|nr:PREDICTED: uncharacterized protein LOC106804698 [Priapulus caudatus]XP_014661470.1 PREDICTED: uncharacterized protein LOC106804698 [Priapulus caudatus]XP_014661471.1 PREDICTED: uncharacterized protein LOC106804698 [Priapulus caudatus]
MATTTYLPVAMAAPDAIGNSSVYYRCTACWECFFTVNDFSFHAQTAHCKMLICEGHNSCVNEQQLNVPAHPAKHSPPVQVKQEPAADGYAEVDWRVPLPGSDDASPEARGCETSDNDERLVMNWLRSLANQPRLGAVTSPHVDNGAGSGRDGSPPGEEACSTRTRRRRQRKHAPSLKMLVDGSGESSRQPRKRADTAVRTRARVANAAALAVATTPVKTDWKCDDVGQPIKRDCERVTNAAAPATTAGSLRAESSGLDVRRPSDAGSLAADDEDRTRASESDGCAPASHRETKRRKVECRQCNAVFSSERLLKLHRAAAHSRASRRTHCGATAELHILCVPCAKSYSTKSQLWHHRHSKAHSLHVCDTCETYYRIPRRLTAHKSTKKHLARFAEQQAEKTGGTRGKKLYGQADCKDEVDL